MKIRVSDFVKKQVSASGKRQIAIAKDVGLSTVQLRKILKDQDMEMKHILSIGKSINFDFSQQFPELNSEKLTNILSEPDVPYQRMGNVELRDQIIEIKSRYIKLLEEHILLLKEFKNLKE